MHFNIIYLLYTSNCKTKAFSLLYAPGFIRFDFLSDKPIRSKDEMSCNFCSDRAATTTGKCMTPIWEYWRKVSIPRTQQPIVQFWSPTENQKPCGYQIALLYSVLLRCYRWDICVKCFHQGHINSEIS